ncbi:MAG: hypothetical protein CMN30_22345 [Sandaracinus sp.]|nr:hypothetical protein [Sandaracinus sp.]
MFIVLVAITVLAGCEGSAAETDPSSDGGPTANDAAPSDAAANDAEPPDASTPDGGPFDAGTPSADAGTSRCATTLMELIGRELGGHPILVSANTEVHCTHGMGSCYEGIEIFDDGRVWYQNVLLEESSVACEELPALTPPELSELRATLGELAASEFADFADGTCHRSDPEADDFGVDAYRGALPTSTPSLDLLIDNTSCRGMTGSLPVKALLDRYWASISRDGVLR